MDIPNIPSTILIVDDSPVGRETLEAVLYNQGYQLLFAHDGPQALAQAIERPPDLILLDVMMPVMDGFEVCRRLRATPLLAEVPIIIVTTLDDQKSRLQGLEAGADDFLSKPFNRLELRARVRTITRLNRYRHLRAEREKLAQAYDETLLGWAKALELRDNETEGHSQRVTDLTVQLARKMGFSEAEITQVRRGALLHDIGKMGVPDRILRKPGPLTDEEWTIMRQHPVYAHQMLSSIAYLRSALAIPYCHHEKWDGTGYPQGLRAEQIPLAARLFAIVDVWDALRSDRPYRAAWPEARVYDYIRQQAGAHFDPHVVELFMDMITE